ncbi:hypothetical protein [uncultured Draconibacterium sp.]|uniref:hypothetical protein n=1 Tax=uncultured Draconibacterium sp. TaxID=1573823 RepID=UPI00325FF783
MKTKSNVQKAILRSAAVVISFVLISFTVSAQTFWKRLLENTGFSDIVIAMASPVDEEAAAEVPATVKADFYFTNEVEPAMELEAWMTDDSRFGTSWFIYEEAVEERLEVENWMLEESRFEPSVETEEELKVEAWMVAEKTWSI